MAVQSLKMKDGDLRHNEVFYELLDGPYKVKYINFKLLQLADYILRMDNYGIMKELLERKFYGRRSVGIL
jgi:hypothetical protein